MSTYHSRDINSSISIVGEIPDDSNHWPRTHISFFSRSGITRIHCISSQRRIIDPQQQKVAHKERQIFVYRFRVRQAHLSYLQSATASPSVETSST
jgi:hypothetical protein